MQATCKVCPPGPSKPQAPAPFPPVRDTRCTIAANGTRCKTKCNKAVRGYLNVWLSLCKTCSPSPRNKLCKACGRFLPINYWIEHLAPRRDVPANSDTQSSAGGRGAMHHILNITTWTWDIRNPANRWLDTLLRFGVAAEYKAIMVGRLHAPKRNS